MKDAYTYLTSIRAKESYDYSDMELYANMYAYSVLGGVCHGEDDINFEFEASTYVVEGFLSQWPAQNEERKPDNIIYSYLQYRKNGEAVRARYDVDSGDLGDYINYTKAIYNGDAIVTIYTFLKV